VRRKALARPSRPFGARCAPRLLQPGLDVGETGRDLFEDEGILLVVERGDPELFRALAVPGPLEHPEDRGEPRDPLIGRGIGGLKHRNIGFQRIGPGRFLGHGQHHRLERVDVVWKLQISRVHDPEQSMFRPGFPQDFGIPSHSAAGFYPAVCGRLAGTARTRFQSIPSTSAMSWAWLSCTRLCPIRGQQNAAFSSRLA